MSECVTVATRSDIPENSAVCVQAAGRRIAIYNLAGQFYATDDTCTHAQGSLSEGQISGDEIVCPLHCATFNIATGQCTGGPAFEDVQSYPVRVVGDEIQVAL
jgi:nitrite reductase/ring-hydroxylating ferredoxin subunit